MLSPEEQISEIDWMINGLNKSKLPGYRIAKKCSILKELRILKKEIINQKNTRVINDK